MKPILTLSDSFVPLVFLVVCICAILVICGPDNIPSQSQPVLIVAGLLSLFIARYRGIAIKVPLQQILIKQSRQGLPVLIILVLIGTISATWMYSGVVPTLIVYGVELLRPQTFLVTTCIVCAVVSLLSGSSWTTIATIGVAFMGIGIMWGVNTAVTAGAIISGAYFGDKISPMSDTTVLASSTCGVELFVHIRNMLTTTLPALVIALIGFGVLGYFVELKQADSSVEAIQTLQYLFNIDRWTLMIPLLTIMLFAFKVNTLVALSASTVFGVIGLYIFQPIVLERLTADAGGSQFIAIAKLLSQTTTVSTDNTLVNDLISTGGITGMWTTIRLVVCAMFFGSCMIASGMLSKIAEALTQRLRRRPSLVTSTVFTGLTLNCFTGDQYLSIILNGSIYRSLYNRNMLSEKLLSRTVEDSTSVTSVLIPWNSCGITQSTVLGVSTFAYLPYCFFNLLSPIVTIAVSWIVYRQFKIPFVKRYV